VTTYNVYGNETPAVVDGDDNDDYALGTVVQVGSVTGTIIKARQYFSNPLPSGPVTWHVSDLATLDLLGSYTFTSPVSGWVEQNCTPIPIVGPRNLLVWCGTPDGYVYTNGKFTSAAIVSGPLTAPRSADDPQGIGNGRFGGDPTSPPSGTSGATAYFADLVFEVLPPQGQAAFTLGLAPAGTGARDSAGVAAAGLGLAVATTGEAPPIPPSEGVVEFGIALTLAGTGLTPAPTPPAEGVAAFTLGLTPAAAGKAPSAGVAALEIRFAIAGTGNTPTVAPLVAGPRLITSAALSRIVTRSAAA